MTMLGTLLIQPQALARMSDRRPAAELADELLALLHRLALDPAAQAAVLPAVQGAGEALGERLAAHLQDKLPQGLAALRTLAAEPLAAFTALGQGEPDMRSVLGRVADLLDTLAGATERLSDAALRAGVHHVWRLLTQDFGLAPALIARELQVFVSDLRTRLADTGPTGHALGSLLGRVQRELLPAWQAPRLDTDALAAVLITALRRNGVAAVRDQAACLLTRVALLLRTLADVARQLMDAVPPPPPPPARPRRAARPAPPMRALTTVPPRSADGSFCWYASWLYATRLQGIGGSGIGGGTAFAQTITPGYPEDEVWLSSDRMALVLRRAGADDELLHSADQPFAWHEALQFKGTTPARPVQGSDHAEHFLVQRIGPEFLETWARVTAILAEFASGMWHFIAMGSSPKEYAVNIPMWLWTWARGVVAAAADAPLPSAIAQAAGWGMGGKYVFAPLPTLLANFGGSFEGVHTQTGAGNGFLQWLTLLGGDALNSFTIHTVTQAVRSLSLSVFTLINYDGPATATGDTDTRPRNWDAAGPVIGLVNTGIGMIFYKFIIPRHDHGLPIGGNATPFLLWYFVGATVTAITGSLLGTFTGWMIARTVTPGQLWKEPLKAVIIGLLTHLVQLYSNKEGDTDDGQYNPTIDADGNPIVPARLPFAEYPPADSSPYRLPVAAGSSTYVGQAHQGFFSHMRYNGLPQIYAYDFAHDFRDEILCVRDGTVVDWFDFYPDDTELDFNEPGDVNVAFAVAAQAQAQGLLVAGQTGFNGQISGNWNFIMVRHDSVDSTHDRDQGGAVVQTYAVYGHGAFQGVRDAFAARGVAPASIVGTVVQRGQVLMMAGDTGVSFHNHLHLHVLGATASTPAAAPVLPNTLSGYTLPFVFAEARHTFGRSGPLRHLTWYRSENPRLG